MVNKGTEVETLIRNNVNDLYWFYDINCARTMLMTLSLLFNVILDRQVIDSATGLNGAGGCRAQCGLVEGGLMFIAIYSKAKEKTDKQISDLCHGFAGEYSKRFKSITCHDLRSNGFTDNDPPHLCEELTNASILFAYNFIIEQLGPMHSH